MPISETDKDRIISAWLSRHNYSKSAELLGMDRKTVRRWVMRWVGGESMRHRRGGGAQAVAEPSSQGDGRRAAPQQEVRDN